jgi:dCMP deaminase
MSESLSWNTKFIAAAKLIACWSKDPSTAVGCVIVDDDHNILSTGYNGFPRKIKDDDRLFNREIKLKIIVHAEKNAIAAAARCGHALLNGTAYVTLFPCSQCASLLIQAGIKKVITPFPDNIPDRWKEDCDLAKELFRETGIIMEEWVAYIN